MRTQDPRRAMPGGKSTDKIYQWLSHRDVDLQITSTPIFVFRADFVVPEIFQPERPTPWRSSH